MLLTKMLGIYFLVMGVALFTNREMFTTMIKELAKKTTAPAKMIIGLINLIVGLLIVFLHGTSFDGAVETIISLTGWIALLKGVAYFALPNFASKMIGMWGKKIGVAAVLTLLIGAYMTYQGFFV